MSSWLACILIGLPTPSSTQSTLENDGMTAADVVAAEGGPVGREVEPLEGRAVRSR